MEFSELQELRSREKVSLYAVFWATMMGGMFIHGMPAAGMSPAGSWISVLGRDFHFPVLVSLVLHYLGSALYAYVIAKVIYRLSLLPAVVVGTLVTIGLYAINWVVFGFNSETTHLAEIRVFFSHLLFGITASVAYKGASIPTVTELQTKPSGVPL